tara:strand:- start:17894 stop:19513 length:1620 start_codon:yes stop_codon:yes gene_type:complete
MKTRNIIAFAVLSALSINVAAETNFIVKPLDKNAAGIDIGGGFKRISIDDAREAKEVLKSLVDSGLYQSIELDTKVSTPEINKQFAYRLAQKNGISGQSTQALDDPFFPQQPYLLSSEYYINGTNLQRAAEFLDDKFEDGGETVRVLVVDGSFYPNNELPYVEGHSFAQRDDGLISRPSFYALEPAGACSVEHGTGVASVYGAIRNNGSLIAGAAPNIELVAAEALVCDSGTIGDVVRSMYWGMGETINDETISNPVDIINLSLGIELDTCSPSFQSALDLAQQRGVQVFASAGNDGVDSKTNSPSNCDNIIVTGSIRVNDDTVADFSNFGDKVDVYAQGEEILGLDGNEGTVAVWQGTSFSTPLAGSTGALLKSYFSDVTPEQAEWFIKNGVRTLSSAPMCDSMSCDKGQLDALSSSQRAYEYFIDNTTSIKPVLRAGEDCLSTYVGLNFAKQARLCELYEVSFESGIDRDALVFELHSTPVQGGESTTVLKTSEVSIITDEIDLVNFNYHYSVCFNGECAESPLEFYIDKTTPQECP